MNYRIGDQVGGYEITGILGAGGMGEIYEVRNVISDRVEAMKVLLSDLRSEAELAERFMREIKVQARLRHPNIAGLNTAFEADGQLIMIMELVDGETVSDLLKRKGLTPRAAIDTTTQALSALAYAHAQGVVHRDIKPSNIMVAKDGTAKIMDFGIAKAVKDKSLTRTGNLIGSLHYMSPEQVRGDTDIDGRTDIYSLGIVLYEMVTGRKPFDGNSEFSIMKAHLDEAPVPPDELDASIDPDLSDVILTAMAKDREERYQTAAAFLADLQDVTSVASHSAPVELPAIRPHSRPAVDPEITGYQRVSTDPGQTPPPEPPTARPSPPVRESDPAPASRSRLKTISGERSAPVEVPGAPPEPAVRRLFPKVAIGVGIAAAVALGFLIPSWLSDDSAAPPEPPAVKESTPEAGPAFRTPEPDRASQSVSTRPPATSPTRPRSSSSPAPQAKPEAAPVVVRQPPPASTAAPEPTQSASEEKPTPAPAANPEPAAMKPAPPPTTEVASTPAPEEPAPTSPSVTSAPSPTPAASGKNPPSKSLAPAKTPTAAPPVKVTSAPTAPVKPPPDPDRVYTIKDEGVRPPQMVHQVQPQYTAQARTNRTQGRVILEAEVWPDGLPHNIEILKSIGDSGLDQNAIAALRRWRFAAGTKDGRPVKVRIAVALSFRLM